MDDPSAQVIEWKSYWLSISVIFYLKNILGRNIFLSGGNKEQLIRELKVVDIFILS